MAQSCSKGSILAAPWINICFQQALRHAVSYRAREGIKLSCQILEDSETCDRWHLVYLFASCFSINVYHLPFKEVAKKKRGLKRRLLSPLFLWMHSSCGEPELGEAGEQGMGNLSWVQPWTGREPAGCWGQCVGKEQDVHTA